LNRIFIARGQFFFGVLGWYLEPKFAMKRVMLGLVAAGVAAVPAVAQTEVSANVASATSRLESTAYTCVEQGAHHKIWERTEMEIGPNGEQRPHIRRYTELATGLSRWDSTQAKWVDSEERIESVSGGAVARLGAHRVSWANDLSATGAVLVEAADGKQFNSSIIGLAYWDTSTGQSVLLAEVKSCQGKIVAPNQVIYEDAFDDVTASVLYAYTKAGFEQDILIQGQLPDPSAFNLNSQSTVLQVLTEFFSPPQPKKKVGHVRFKSGVTLEDDDLDFGGLKFIRGKAFSAGNSRNCDDVPVSRQWLRLEGRDVLVEQVSLPDIQAQLEALPKAEGASVGKSSETVKRTASLQRRLPARRATGAAGAPLFEQASLQGKALPGMEQAAVAVGKGMEVATLGGEKPCFVIDYATISGSATNYTFCTGNTYFFSGAYNLYGSNNIVEGLAVLKFASGASINFPSGFGTSRLEFRSSPYQLAIFTGKDDNSVGDDIGGSTGNPYGSYYASPCLSFGAGGAQTISYARFAYAKVGVAQNGGSMDLSHVQFINSQCGLAPTGATNFVHNGLFATVGTNFLVQGTSIVAVEHGTFDGSAYLGYANASGGSLKLTNCVLVSQTNLTNANLPVDGGYNGFYNCGGAFGAATNTNSARPFTVVGAGGYYITNGGFLNVGTTNVSASLLSDLGRMTTYPPQVYSDATLAVATNFGPRAPRDSNTAPSLGYHYTPLDYCFGGCYAATNVTFTAGTGVGWFQTSSSRGLDLANYVTLRFDGRADQQCYWALALQVQDGANRQWPFSSGGPGSITGSGASQDNYDIGPAPQVSARFTKFPLMCGRMGVFRDNYAYLVVRLTDCEINGVGAAGYGTSFYLTNCLVDALMFGITEGWPGNAICCENSTFHRGTFYLNPWKYNVSVDIHNCVFDFQDLRFSTSKLTSPSISYNAFYTNTVRFGGYTNGDWVMTNGYTWLRGPLGDFYQQTNSPLINRGSTNAASLGLTAYTVQTNQLEEGNTLVDMGYHYLALNAPVITSQPAAQTIGLGQSATLAVSATGTEPKSYQWLFQGGAVAGATNASLALTNVSESSQGNYGVVVSNRFGIAVSSNALVSVDVPPTILSQPVSVSAKEGGLVVFNILAKSSRPINYQWRWKGSKIPNAVSSQFKISSARLTNAGNYSVVLSNALGSTNSIEVMLVVTNDPPLITKAPTNQTVLLGSNAVLNVTATGAEPLAYQWYLNGSSLLGATQKVLAIPSVTAEKVGSYNVIVTNLWGRQTSAVATLQVGVPPVITASPSSVLAAEGDKVAFAVSALGSGPLHYRWMVNDLPIAGATNSIYTLSNVSVANITNSVRAQLPQGGWELFLSNYTADYWVIVTNEYGRATSSYASLVLSLAPRIVVQPKSVLSDLGGSCSFAVSVEGTGPLSYQWMVNNSPIEGATNGIYTLADIDKDQGGTYTVAISNLFGCVTSLDATLTCNAISARVQLESLRTSNQVISGSISCQNGVIGWQSILITTNANGISQTQATDTLSGTDLKEAAWKPYTGNFEITLGPTNGVYNVAVGLMGPGVGRSPTWQVLPVTLDTDGPVVCTTNPLQSGKVSKPRIQLRGRCNEQLQDIQGTIQSGLGGEASSLKGFVTGVAGTDGGNSFEFLDVDLQTGTNLVKLTATDVAGNVSSTNLIYVLDASWWNNMPIPSVRIDYPGNGSLLNTNSISISGFTDDENASVYVSDSSSNCFNGIVGRDGVFWITNISLAEGSNFFALYLSNSAGKAASTNFAVFCHPNEVSNYIYIDDVSAVSGIGGQYLVSGRASGTIAVINGVSVPVNDNGYWTATLTLGKGPLAMIVASNSASGGAIAPYTIQNPNWGNQVVSLNRHDSSHKWRDLLWSEDRFPFRHYFVREHEFATRDFDWSLSSGGHAFWSYNGYIEGVLDRSSRSFAYWRMHSLWDSYEYAASDKRRTGDSIYLTDNWGLDWTNSGSGYDIPYRLFFDLGGVQGETIEYTRGSLSGRYGGKRHEGWGWWLDFLSVNADARVGLKTPGVSVPGGLSRLYQISGRCAPIMPDPGYLIDSKFSEWHHWTFDGIGNSGNARIYVPGLRRYLDANGQAVAVLPDGITVDLTFVAPFPFYRCSLDKTEMLPTPNLKCPDSVSVMPDRDPSTGKFSDGAVVSYAAPPQNFNYDSIQFAPPSGTRFPIGTSNVVCKGYLDGQPISECSFSVTVLSTNISQVSNLVQYLREPSSRPGSLSHGGDVSACVGETVTISVTNVFTSDVERVFNSNIVTGWLDRSQHVDLMQKWSRVLTDLRLEDAGYYSPEIEVDGVKIQCPAIYVDVLPTNLTVGIQPKGGSVPEGTNFMLQVGGLPLDAEYIWSKDGSPVAGPRYVGNNTAMLTISPTTREDSGVYWVTAITPCARVTSSPAFVTVCGTVWTNTSTIPIGNLFSASNVTISASSQRFAATNAFNGIIATNVNDWTNCWLPQSSFGAWLRVDLPATKTISSYDIYTSVAADVFSNVPSAEVFWVFQGSLDGTNWFALHTGSIPLPWTNGVKKTFAFGNTNSYSHYQLTNYGVWAGGSRITNEVGISELRLNEGQVLLLSSGCGSSVVVDLPADTNAPLIQIAAPWLVLSNTIVSTNWVTVTDSDSGADEVQLTATPSDTNFTAVVSRLTSNGMKPATNLYEVKVVAKWGYLGTCNISLNASNITPAYAASIAVFQASAIGGTLTNGFSKTRLGYWRFNDEPGWRDEGGLAPCGTNGLMGIPSWSGQAVTLNAACQSLLEYRCQRGASQSNAPTITYDAGSIRFWFRPDWGGRSAGGAGPGQKVRLFEAGREVSYDWILALSDVTNASVLLNKLNTASNLSDGLAYVIRSRLSSTYDLEQASTSAQCFKRVIEEINMMILGNCLYDAGAFTTTSLRPETSSLLNSHPGSKDMPRLNRMLLEDSFPNAIAAKPVAPQGSSPGWLGISVNQHGTMLEVERQSGFNHQELVSAAIALPQHEWCQAVLTFETNAATQVSKLYFNGWLVATNLGSLDAGLVSSLITQGTFRVGCGWGGQAQADGAFDELETFNYPLSGDEIAANYQSVVTRDTDGDGLPDVFENGIGTNPQAMDTDCDGLPDGWEYERGYNPSDSGDFSSALLRSYQQGLLRADQTNSHDMVVQVRPGRNAAYLTWDGVAGAISYSLYRSTAYSGAFDLVGVVTNTRFFSDEYPALEAGATYFYRVECLADGTGQGLADGYALTLKSEVASVTPFGCASNPPPYLSYIKTLSLPSLNGSYIITPKALYENSALVNIGGRPLLYAVDKITSGTLIVNGLPFGPNNQVISNNCVAIWTPPAGVSGTEAGAFTAYVTDGTQRFDKTAGVKIQVQAEQHVYGWGLNDDGQLGTGRYFDTYLYRRINGVWSPNWSSRISQFGWCNGSKNAWTGQDCSECGDRSQATHATATATITNYTIWESKYGVIPLDGRWSPYQIEYHFNGDNHYYVGGSSWWETTPTRVLDLPSSVTTIGVGTGNAYFGENGRQAFAVGADGKLWQWGTDWWGMFGRIFDFAQTNIGDGINIPGRALRWGFATPSGWTNHGNPMPIVTLPCVYTAPKRSNEVGQSFDNVQMVCGDVRTRVALKRDGTLWSWGDATYLGRQLDESLETVTPADSSLGHSYYIPGAKALAAFDYAPGRVMIPGNDTNGVNPGRRFVEVCRGLHNVMARCRDGSVWWWGDMAYGMPALPELGWGWYNCGGEPVVPFVARDESRPFAPVCLGSLGATNDVANPIIQMSAARNHFVFLRADGSVCEFGYVPSMDMDGSLASGAYNASNSVPVVFENNPRISSVQATPDYAVALDENGVAWAWGWINGTLISLPQTLPMRNLVKVVCSGNTVLALDKRGNIWGWGDSSNHGILGIDPYTSWNSEWSYFGSTFKTRPVRINGVEHVSDLFSGGDSAFVVGVAEEGKPTGLTAAGLDQQVHLNWASYLSAPQYKVYRSLDADVGYSLIGISSNTTFLDGVTAQAYGQVTFGLAALTNNATYYYKVSAIINGVESPTSREIDGTPQPKPSTVPNVVLTNRCRTVVLAWDLCTNASQSNPLEYRVERALGTNANAVFEPVAHCAPAWGTKVSRLQYEDAHVRTNTTYSYRVVAVNDAGISPQSNVVSTNTGVGNCLDAPQFNKPNCNAEIVSSTVSSGGTSSNDGDDADSILLGESSSAGNAVTSGSNSGTASSETVTVGRAYLEWVYPANQCADISAFRFRYQYLVNGVATGGESTLDVSITNSSLGCDVGTPTNVYSYYLEILPQKPCAIQVSVIRRGEESRSSSELRLIADDSAWKIAPRAIPGYQQVYVDWQDSDMIYSYEVDCSSAIPYSNMPEDGYVPLVSDQLDCRIWHTGLNSSNFTAADVISVSRLTERLFNANANDDLVALAVWNLVSTNGLVKLGAYKTLNNAQTSSQISSTRQVLVDELNAIIHRGTNLFSLAQVGLTNGDLSTRTRQSLSRQAQSATNGAVFSANDIAELNRFLLEDTFAEEIARYKELPTQEFVAADIRKKSLTELVNQLVNGDYPSMVQISNAMVPYVSFGSINTLVQSTNLADQSQLRRILAIGLTGAIQNLNLSQGFDTNWASARVVELAGRRAQLSTNELVLLNRLFLEDERLLGNCLNPLTGLRYYSIVGLRYDGTPERNTSWVAAQPLDGAAAPPALNLNASAYAYSSMVLVQWYVPGFTNYAPGMGSGWQFYVERKTLDTSYSPLATAGFGLAYLDQEVANGQAYTYRVTAFDANFNRYVAVVTATPNYTNGLILMPVTAGNGYLDLSWTPVRAASYNVEHSLDLASFDTVGTIGNNGDAYQNPDNHFRHAGIQNGVPHYYRVRATTPTGVETLSNTNSGVPLASLPPLPPSRFNADLTASPDGLGARVALAWNLVSGADHYQVFIRQSGVLTQIYEGRQSSCWYDVPLETADGASLVFGIRCVTVDNLAGELKEITAVYAKDNVPDNSSTNAVRLKVGGWYREQMPTNVFGPTNLTLGVECSLPIRRVTFYDDDGNGNRKQLAVVSDEPYAYTWREVKAGEHNISATIEVKLGDNVASGTANIGVVYPTPISFQVIIKPELAAYTASATDLQINAPGLPIVLARSYTSHNTGSSLLGAGWTPGWNGGAVRCSTPLDSGWQGATNSFLKSTTYVVGTASNHEVTVTLPSGQELPFWVTVEGQSFYDPTSTGLYASLVIGPYDATEGTLSFNGAGSRIGVQATAVNSWVTHEVTLRDLDSEDPLTGAYDPITLNSFTYVSPDNTSYLYASDGGDGSWLLTSVTDRNGNSLTYAYGDGSSAPRNQIVGITNSCGRGIGFAYTNLGNGATNIIEVFDAIGGTNPVVVYAVRLGQLAEVRRLARREDPSSYEVTRYVYGTGLDNSNRIVEVYDPQGVLVVGNSYMSAASEYTAGNLWRQTNTVNTVTTYDLNIDTMVLTVVQSNAAGCKAISVAHDDSGAIIGATQPASGTTAPTALAVTNTYDERGRLIFQRNALGGIKSYSYDEQDHLLGQSDELNQTTSSEVNWLGEPTKMKDANGNSSSSYYDDQGNPIRVEDASKTVTTYEYAEARTAANGRALGRRLLRETRNAPGVSYTAVTEYAYYGESESEASSPAFGEVKSVTQKCGVVDDNGVLQQLLTPIRVIYEYDANGNRTAEIKSRSVGGVVESITNQSVYDAQNRVVGSSVVSSRSGTMQTSGMSYNRIGKQQTSVDAAMRVTTNTYDFAGNLIETTYPDGTVSRTAYNLDGKPEYVQDRAVNADTTVAPATRTTYDASGRTVKVERFSAVTFTRLSADNPDFVGQASGVFKMTATSPTGLLTATRTFYDDLGRVRFSVDARTNVTASLYDAVGRRTNSLVYMCSSSLVANVSDAMTTSGLAYLLGTVVPDQSTSYTYDPNGNQLSFTDTLGRTTTSVYDDANRLMETDYPDAGQGKRSHFTTYDGLGQRVQEMDENGVLTKYQYDFRGLLTCVILAADTTEAVTTSYEYDELGNLVKQTDANGHSTTFQYDALGRRISRKLPEGQSEGYAYDLAGNMCYQTNFNGVVITNQYDVGNRLLRRTARGGYAVSFGYSGTGQRMSMSDPSGYTSYGYNGLNQLTNKTVTSHSGATYQQVGVLNYAYDFTGTLTNIHNDWTDLSYGYDSLGRLTNVVANGMQTVGYGFDKVGNLQYIRYGNGVTNLYQYDARNRLTNQMWKLGGNSLASFAYELGATGTRSNLSETVGDVSRTYAWTYDRLSRLTGESITGGILATFGYGYDVVGNRTNRLSSFNSQPATSSTATYSANDWLGGDGYDTNGNTTSSSTNVYHYDALNHLTNVNSGAVVITYDGDGNRASKTVGGVTTYYLPDDRNPSGYVQVIQECQVSSGSMYPIKAYDYGLGLVSQRSFGTVSHAPSGLWYYGIDGHGSVRFLMNSSGTVTDTYTYDAYGNVIDQSGSTSNNYRYCGEQYDPDLGFYYLRARYYKPETGRFWTMDTVEGHSEDPLSLHKYLYCGANPINGIDPSGHDGDFSSLMVSMAIGGGLNASYTAAMGYRSGKSGSQIWDESKTAFAVGAITAPIGGFAFKFVGKALGPVVQQAFQPLARIIGSMDRQLLVGRSGVDRLLVQMSRFFVNSTRSYPKVTSTALGRTLQTLFPSVDWEMHHVLIQQAWSKAGGPNQIYDDLVANEGLRRLGNGLWNLLPIPRSLNGFLGRSPAASALFATAYYGLVAYGTDEFLGDLASDD
jgi:RHS repeat-associated protein